MKESLILTLDIGTTSIKTGLFNLDGEVIGFSTNEYELSTPEEDIVELAPDDYWENCLKGIDDIFDKANVNKNLVSMISFSSQAETLICIDEHGKTLGNAIVWLDSRAKEEADLLSEVFSDDNFYKTTGLPEISPIWPASKILWLKNNALNIFNKTDKFLIVKDYLVWKLTGEFTTEPTVSSSTGYFKISEKKWWGEMLDLLEIRKKQLPSICASSEIVGSLTDEASRKTGLPKNCKVLAGSMDQMAAAAGAGNIKRGIITESTGTALAVLATVLEPTFDPKRRIPCAPHLINDKYVLMPYSETSGIVLKWFKNNFFDNGSEKRYDKLMEMAYKTKPGAEGLIALPHFSGTIFPDFNPDARGAFVGVSFKHQRGHFIRAIIESISFALKDNLKGIKDLSIPVERVISLGGAAKSDLWSEIKANVINSPIDIPEKSESASLGAMILAGIALGRFKDFEQAVDEIVYIKKTFKPDSKLVSLYREIYCDYLSLYRTLYGAKE